MLCGSPRQQVVADRESIDSEQFPYTARGIGIFVPQPTCLNDTSDHAWGLSRSGQGLPLPDAAQFIADGSLSSVLFGAAQELSVAGRADLRDPQYQSFLKRELPRRCGNRFRQMCCEVSSILRQPPFLALVRGLDFDQGDIVLAAICVHLGKIVDPYNQPWSQLICDVRPSKDRLWDGAPLNERLHTDSTDWIHPNDYTVLACIEPDQNRGGMSRILAHDNFARGLSEAGGSDLIELLSVQPVPWRLADAFGGGVTWSPIFGTEKVRWMRYTIQSALDVEKVTLPLHLMDALVIAETVLFDDRVGFQFSLTAGDLLIIDNHRCLHGRTAIPNAASSRRFLRRAKLYRYSE